MQKPLIFISHITAEKEIADALRGLIESTFMGMIDVFISSDPESIAMGGKWLDRITQGLQACVIEIVLASPTSIRRPWINFEAGAGWVRGIPVIPICHSGMNPDTLPPPLSSLQSALATESDSIERVLSVLAKALECKMPKVIDVAPFITCVNEFETLSLQIENVTSEALTSEKNGLATYEVATLIAIAECTDVPGDWVWPTSVKRRMSEAGYRDIASAIGIASLRRKGLIDTQLEFTGNFDEKGATITVNPRGWEWLEGNLDSVMLATAGKSTLVPDAEIPF